MSGLVESRHHRRVAARLTAKKRSRRRIRSSCLLLLFVGLFYGLSRGGGDDDGVTELTHLFGLSVRDSFKASLRSTFTGAKISWYLGNIPNSAISYSGALRIFDSVNYVPGST